MISPNTIINRNIFPFLYSGFIIAISKNIMVIVPVKLPIVSAIQKSKIIVMDFVN